MHSRTLRQKINSGTRHFPFHACVSDTGGVDGGSTLGSTYGFIAGTIPNSEREIQFALKLIF